MLDERIGGNPADAGYYVEARRLSGGDDDNFAWDCRCGYHGTNALAGRAGSTGAEIGRHPQDARFRQSGFDVDP